MANTQEVVSGWWRYQNLTSGNREERLAADEWYWAWDEVASMVTARPIDAIELLVLLAEAAPTDVDLDVVGAGPIESLIYEHRGLLLSPEGRSLIERLDQAARRSPKFSQALASVWYGSDEVPEQVRAQVSGLPPPLDEQ